MGQKNKIINLEKDTLGSDYVTLRIRLKDEILLIPNKCIYVLDIERFKKWALSIRYATLESFSETDIQLNARCEQEELMILSIPYDEDWEICINAKKKETFPVFGGLTGVKAGKGDNEIQIHFKPKGLGAGAIISVVSVIIVFVLLRDDAKKSAYRTGTGTA